MTGQTLLFRQVNPSWVHDGRITSQVFRPTPKDEKHLSVYDGDLITAEQAWTHFTLILGHSSTGVMAVSVEECRNQSLPAIPDPGLFPEHAFIDFSQSSEGEIRKKAKYLRAAAESRGWQHHVEM